MATAAVASSRTGMTTEESIYVAHLGRLLRCGVISVERRYADAVAHSLGWRPEPGQSHLFAVGIKELKDPLLTCGRLHPA